MRYIIKELRINKNSDLINYKKKENKNILEFLDLLILNDIVYHKYNNIYDNEIKYDNHIDINDFIEFLENNNINSISFINTNFNNLFHKFINYIMNSNISKLSLYNVNFSNCINKYKLNDIEMLFDILNHNNYLTELYLINIKLSTDNIIYLCEKLIENTTILTTLNLIDCNINNENLILLSEVINNNKTLTSIDLSNNHIIYNDIGFEDFCNSLNNNININTLNLSHNYLEKINIQNISNMLLYNSSITELNLSNCYIRNNINDLRINNYLIKLNILNNEIYDLDNYNIFLNQLNYNNSLAYLYLDLEYNYFEILKKLEEILKNNITLIKYNI